MYFEDNSIHGGLSTPLKENHSAGDFTGFATPSTEIAKGGERTVRKRLLASNSKLQTKSSGKDSSSEFKLKTPTKTPRGKASAGKSTTKKSAKKTPTVSAKKKKRIAELESEVQEIEESISKLKKQSSNLKSKMTRLAKSESEVKFPVKDELIEKLDLQGRPLEPLPVPLIKLEDLLPNEAVHDAIAVWNFINSFNKQLSIAITWDDFIDLLKFTHSTSPALIDLFSAPLKLILSDPLSLNRLHATLPKKVHFSFRLGEEEREVAASQLILPNLNNFEDFDCQYNGLKLFPRKLQADQVDSLRWNSLLRGVFLRLEPIRQLRKAVSEANVALQYYQDKGNRLNDSTESDSVILQFIHTLQELNQKYYFLPQRIQSGDNYSPDISKKKVLFETPSKADRNDEDLVTFITTGKKIALDSETMSRINTPKSKSRNKSSGLNKDAIFNISSNFLLNLHEYYEIAKLLETREVHELSPLQKLTILKVLCDACMDTDRIQRLMERNAEERANQIQQMNRLAKEQKLKMKEVSSTKREAALEACRRLNREKASDSKKGEKREAQAKKGNASDKGSKAKSNFEPSVEQLSAMIDDLIGLEQYGIDTVREDPTVDEISESEDDEEVEEEADEHESEVDIDEGEPKRGRSANRRKPALVRTRAMSRQRSRSERMQRNNTISYAFERMTLALERNTERELRSAIKVAERSGFKGVDEKTGQVYVTESLKNVYRQLNELEAKAREDKLASKHEKALEDYFVRTEPLGSDRYHRTYWKFMADDNRLFVEDKVEDEATKAFGPCPPPPSSSNAIDQIVLNRLFESRPNRYKYRWLVYSTPSELWKLCEALDDRGEREKDLKAAIRARFDIEPPAVVYQTSGSEFIGRKIQRTFGRKTVYGKVVGWLPATEEDQALWHVVHVDGDEEDLDEDELKIALLDDEDERAKQVLIQNDEVEERSGNTEELDTHNDRMDDGKDEENQSEDNEIVVPAIAKKSTGLIRAYHHSRNATVNGLHGIEGLVQECQRFLNIISDSLKKKLNDQFSREEKKNFEQKLRDAESLEDLQKFLLQMEDLIHSCQTAPDRREKDECHKAKEEERREMIEEGWTFDETQCEFIGRQGRRYFSDFGTSDGVIVAMLPAERNEGVALFRMVHNDGDREDLESEDLLSALRYYDSNCSAFDIRAELKEQEGEDGEESEDDDDDDDDLLVDDSSQFSNPIKSSEDRLWPTFEVRQRWKEAVSHSRTTGELALAISCLEEHTFGFDLFGESDPIFPLTLFSPPMTSETLRQVAQTSRYPQRQRGNAQNFHHEALSPRKAKKRAISEISKCQKEDSRSVSSDDFEPRRSKRVTGNLQIHSSNSSSNQFYNSGRPSRSAAQKVVSYAV